MDQLQIKLFKYVDQALRQDEQGRAAPALALYQKAFDMATDIMSYQPRDESERKIREQVVDTLSMIEGRLEILQELVHPPSYDEAISSSSSFVSQQQIQEALDEISTYPSDYPLEEKRSSQQEGDACAGAPPRPPRPIECYSNAVELFSVDGVYLFFISMDGTVSSSRSGSKCSVSKFYPKTGEITSPSSFRNAPAFVQVDWWLYPLVKGHSPFLRAVDERSFIFPDVTRGSSIQKPGDCVGVVFPPEISTEKVEEFKNILIELTKYTLPTPKEADQEERVETYEKIARNIAVGAEWVSKAAIAGASYLSSGIKKGSDQFKEETAACEEPVAVKEGHIKAAQVAHTTTHGAYVVSEAVVGAVRAGLKGLAKYAAPRIIKYGPKLLPEKARSKVEDPDNKHHVDGVVNVASSGIKAFGAVYGTLEEGAKMLAKSVANATVVCVNHRYGADAAALAEHGIYTAGNVGLAAYNVTHLEVKALAKTTARYTAVETVHSKGEKH